MRTLHIQSVDVVRGGLVVTYDDETRAFYDESVLMAHLQAEDEVAPRKQPRPVAVPATGRTRRSA